MKGFQEKFPFFKWILLIGLTLNPSLANPVNTSLLCPPNLKQALKVGRERILASGGPANPNPVVYNALNLPMQGMWEEATSKIMADIQDGIRYILETKNEWTFAYHGSGTTAMSAVLDNMIEPGDKVLVLVMGHWGNQYADIAGRFGAVVTKLEKPLWQTVPYAEIEAKVKEVKPKILIVANGESSTAVLQNVDGLGELCHREGCYTIIDVVATVAQIPIKMDERKFDVVYMNSQKGCGGVVGLAPVSYSPRVVEEVLKKRKTTPRIFQTEATRQAKAWLIDNPTNTKRPPHYHSASVPLLYMLREGLAQLAQEGIENVWSRHAATMKYFYQKAEEIGLVHLVQNEAERLPGTTTFKIPEGKDIVKIEQYLLRKYNVEISSGWGSTWKSSIRIGFMAYNSRKDLVDTIMLAVKDALESPETNV